MARAHLLTAEGFEDPKAFVAELTRQTYAVVAAKDAGRNWRFHPAAKTVQRGARLLGSSAEKEGFAWSYKRQAVKERTQVRRSCQGKCHMDLDLEALEALEGEQLMLSCFDCLELVAQRAFEAYCLAENLEVQQAAQAFGDFSLGVDRGKGKSVLNLYHYFSGVEEEPCRAHCDPGLLTVLCRSSGRGLEAQRPIAASCTPGRPAAYEEVWQDMEALMDAATQELEDAVPFLVITGETLERLSGNCHPACLHRVAHTDAPRFNVAFELRPRCNVWRLDKELIDLMTMLAKVWVSSIAMGAFRPPAGTKSNGLGPRRRLWILLGLAVFELWRRESESRAFVTEKIASSDLDDDEPDKRGPLGWLHYDVILASRTSYPVALMIGFTCYGNVMLRKECGDKRYPSWIFGWLLGMVCYTYPGAIFSDLVFVSGAPQRALSNDNIFLCFSFWYLVVQYSDTAYRLLQQQHVFIWLTTWWLADATRASLLFLERAVAIQPVFARGVWQAFVWCVAGPTARLVEKSIRGVPVPTLDKVQPNSMNILKFPLIAMFWNMMVYLAYLTDCQFLSATPKMDMVECGAAHEDFYGFCTYLPCVMHLCRAYWAMYSQGGLVIFGDGFCMGRSHVLPK
ncbi:unnamed protein product [Effrenium voratum]|nr:unnamed protein product [Effrenium voratum]